MSDIIGTFMGPMASAAGSAAASFMGEALGVAGREGPPSINERAAARAGGITIPAGTMEQRAQALDVERRNLELYAADVEHWRRLKEREWQECERAQSRRRRDAWKTGAVIVLFGGLAVTGAYFIGKSRAGGKG